MLFVHPTVQRIAQLTGQGPRLVVAGRSIGGDDDGAQIAKVELVDVGERAFGAVSPLGGAHLRPQLLRQRHQLGGVDLRATLGLGRLVLLVERGPHGGHPAADELLGDGTVLLGQLGDEGAAVGPAGAEALGLRLGLQRRAPLEGPAAVPIGARAPVGPVSAGATGAVTAGPVSPVGAVPAVSAWPAVIPTPADQARGHELVVVPAAADDLQALRFAPHRLRRGDRSDDDAFDVDLDLGLEHHAHGSITRQQRRIDAALGFTGAGGSPGPGAVVPTARQLDINAARHGRAG